MDETALAMHGVAKRFRRGELYDSLRDLIPALIRRGLRGRRPADSLGDREFWALRDISFTARRGEALGIVGRNGAGKSTMLKLLAGIMQPTLGSITVNGRLSALIEVGAGFHPDLTGRENIYLNGAILGMSRDEVRRKFDTIVAFSGLEEFIDTPVKRYSSGMFARLGFSVAAHVDPDILIVDEVLSVGDFVFQRKCHERMTEVLRSGVTVIFVSHNLPAVAELCSRTILLEHGRIKSVGPSDRIIHDYVSAEQEGKHLVDEKDAYLSRVQIRNHGGETSTFRSGEKAWIDIEVVARKPVRDLAVVLDICGEDNRQVCNTSTERLGKNAFSLEPGTAFHCTFELDLHLARGAFRIGAYLHRYDIERQYDKWYPAATFFVHPIEDVRGCANLYPRVVRFGVST